MYLSDGKKETQYIVKDIGLPTGIEKRLEALGMTRGTSVTVLNSKSKGILIVKVRGTRFALGRNPAELVHQYGTADNGVIINDNFTCHLGGIAYDATAAYDGIMCYVYSFHQQVVTCQRRTAKATLQGVCTRMADGQRLPR